MRLFENIDNYKVLEPYVIENTDVSRFSDAFSMERRAFDKRALRSLSARLQNGAREGLGAAKTPKIAMCLIC